MSNLYLFPEDDVNNWNVRASRIYTNNNSALTLDVSGKLNLNQYFILYCNINE